MSLTLNNLAPKFGSRSKRFRIGRGAGSGRGKTAGKGTKGQKSRTGGSHKLKLKGLKQMLLSFPKNRGFQSRYAKMAAIPLKRLSVYGNGETVSMETLREKGLIGRSDREAKIVGSGAFDKKLTVSGVAVTAGSKAAIEAAGGSVK
jgi:large subunit ribosomal protein L15